MAELRMPAGLGTVVVPDDLVAQYRAQGWVPVEPPASDKPEPDESESKTAKSQRKPPVQQHRA